MAISRRTALALGLVWAASVAGVARAEGPPLAIKGYDPVSYFTSGKPQRGSPDIAYEWDDQRYLFATVEHREMFKANPVLYAPQFADFCAMALTRGEILEINPEYWLVRDNKLYLFGKDFGPKFFSEDFAGNVRKAEGHRPLTVKR